MLPWAVHPAPRTTHRMMSLNPFRRRPQGRSVKTPLLLAAALWVAGPVAAQAPPSPEQVLGWELGGRFTDVASVGRYLETLAAASPLVSVDEYGFLWIALGEG